MIKMFNLYKNSNNKLVIENMDKNIQQASFYEIDNSIEKDTIFSNLGLIKKNYIDMKYHQDYAHVISALNNLVPREKTFFNIANMPMTIDECVDIREVKVMVNSFIDLMNTVINEEISNFRQPNTGWDEQLPEYTGESGWEKVQKKLGLAPSLYNKPNFKSKIRLIDLTDLKKYETDDEKKYLMNLIVQTDNSDIQMSFKIGFVIDLRFEKNENNFFKKKDSILDIKIENVFINGYYSDDNYVFQNLENNSPEYEKYDILNNFDDYNNYNSNSNLTSSKEIQKVLLEKYNTRMIENNNRNSLLDEEGRDYHNSLPKLYEYDNIYATQTIFDDMNCKKRFS